MTCTPITGDRLPPLAGPFSVLAAAGKSMDDVIRIGVYLTDMGDFAAINEVYREYLSAPYPARTAIAVAALPLRAVVEFDAITN